MQVFTPWGLLSGLLFTASTANTFAAIHHLGLSVASGVWCGVAVLMSFCWGIFVAGDQLTRPLLATLSLLLLVAGIVGIAAAGELGRYTASLSGHADDGAGAAVLLLHNWQPTHNSSCRECSCICSFCTCCCPVSAGPARAAIQGCIMILPLVPLPVLGFL